MTTNKDLLILLDVYGWSRRKVAREVGVSDVAVIKWLRGAVIREKTRAKIKETVQKFRFHVRPKLTPFPGNKSILGHLTDCGITLDEISKVSRVKRSILERMQRHPGEIDGEFFAKMDRVIRILLPIYSQEKAIDLLDTQSSTVYNASKVPEAMNNPFAQNQSPLPDEAKGQDEYSDQVPW